MSARPSQILCALLCTLSCAGCAVRGDLSIVRFWADWNTLGTPAVYCERLHHRPPAPARVETFRWMYGEGPGVVVPMTPQAEVVYEMPAHAEPPVTPASPIDPLIPLPAPPASSPSIDDPEASTRQSVAGPTTSHPLVIPLLAR